MPMPNHSTEDDFLRNEIPWKNFTKSKFFKKEITSDSRNIF